MTREEAINIVQGARHYLTSGNPIWDIKKIDEAMSMAIEALSAEPTGDLISRAELFNKLATVQAPPEANEYKAEVYKIIQSMGTEENDDKERSYQHT